MNYYIFKTDWSNGITTIICNGSHDTELDCRRHWQCYLYGFMDGAYELLGRGNFELQNGKRTLSFQILIKTTGKLVEYFMLLDKEGQDLIDEISKTPTPRGA